MVSKFEQLVQPICELAHQPLEGTNAKMNSHIGCISPRRQARGRRTLQIPKLTNRTSQDDCTTSFQNTNFDNYVLFDTFKTDDFHDVRGLTQEAGGARALSSHPRGGLPGREGFGLKHLYFFSQEAGGARARSSHPRGCLLAREGRPSLKHLLGLLL